MLLAMSAGVSRKVTGTDRHSPLSGIGTNPATGASIPPPLSRMSSHSVFPLSATMHTPIATSVLTKIACAGV